MTAYLNYLVAQARGERTGIRPVKRPRWLPQDGAEQVGMTIPEVPAARPADGPRKAEPGAAKGVETPGLVSPMPHRMDIVAPAPAPDPAESASPPRAQQPAQRSLPVSVKRPETPRATDMPADHKSAAPQIEHFVEWLEAPAPQERPAAPRPWPVAVRPAGPAQPGAAQAHAAQDSAAVVTAPVPQTHIHIGRVELVNLAPAPVVRTTKPTARPPMSLEDYLARRDGKRR